MNKHNHDFHFRYWSSKTDQYAKSYPDAKIKGTLAEKMITFCVLVRFLMSNSGNESHGHACSYAFGFKYKYVFFEKLEPKTFGDCKHIFAKVFGNNFSENKYFYLNPKAYGQA